MRVAEQRDGVHITLNRTFAAANTRGVASSIRVMHSRCQAATKRHSKECRFALQTWTRTSTKDDSMFLLEQLTAAQSALKDSTELSHLSRVLSTCCCQKDAIKLAWYSSSSEWMHFLEVLPSNSHGILLRLSGCIV
jgi:hypothetical protein